MNNDASLFPIDPATLDAFHARFSPKRVAEGAYADPNDVVLFVHIPKTAGVSLGQSLQESFAHFHGVDWEKPRASFHRLTNRSLANRMHKPQRQVIAGHFSWQELMIWRQHELPIKAISVIRDPVERFISNYNYNCSEKHPGRDGFRERFPTAREYAVSLPSDFQLRQMIGLFYSFDHALEKLTKYYSFLGVTEKMGASLNWLARSHGLQELQEHRMNTAPRSGEQAPDIDPEVREMVTRKSVNDVRLHDLLSSYY